MIYLPTNRTDLVLIQSIQQSLNNTKNDIHTFQTVAYWWMALLTVLCLFLLVRPYLPSVKKILFKKITPFKDVVLSRLLCLLLAMTGYLLVFFGLESIAKAMYTNPITQAVFVCWMQSIITSALLFWWICCIKFTK